MKGLFRKLLLLGFACGFTLLLMEGMIRITGLVPPHGYPKGLFIEDPDTEFIMAPGFPETRFSKQEFETTVSRTGMASGMLKDLNQSPKGSTGCSLWATLLFGVPTVLMRTTPLRPLQSNH